MKRRALFNLICPVVLAVGLVALVMHQWLAVPPVHPSRFEQIHNGMTRAEVEAALGGPPGDYQTGRFSPNDFQHQLDKPTIATVEEWTADSSKAIVAFDKDGRVVDFVAQTMVRGDDRPFHTFRSWFGY